ncbi:hypothetical protein N0V88_004136 [Collariella sp. IMI 366227]|nr:hypothetical protein N0V88_004136 [Collariella sp. IMI 366227]
MSDRRNSLSPPERRDTMDPGAHELSHTTNNLEAEASDDEHYSDAQSRSISPAQASPIPKTRVERVDDKPARQPPGGRPIPKTVVEETPDVEGSVTHPENRQRRKSDAHPDMVVKADGQKVEGGEATDWIRSRIRRLFLVSLGVPVDLDEILPASKQKKLVLPSLHRTTSSGSLRRASNDSRTAAKPRAGGGADRTPPHPPQQQQQQQKRTAKSPHPPPSSTGATPTPADRNPTPERTFDLVTARQTCTLTDAALNGMTDAELQAHVARLEAMQDTAHGVLVYWQRRTDEKIGDREAFEGVIENLVKHARKVRK